MGFLSATEMVAQTDLRTALDWHLRCNHYPPPPAAMIGPCLAAIEAFEDEDYDRLVELPIGITWRDEEVAPARALVESFHLHPFLLPADD